MATAEEAVELLLSCVDARARSLVDVETASAALRRFKLDVSFAGKNTRFSVNDKDEPAAFRARVLAHAETLGIGAEQARRFFASCAPGQVQTTVGMKADRASLYFEELTRSPRPEEVMDAVTARFGGERAPPLPLTPAAICVDFRARRPIAIKDYWMACERSDAPAISLPVSLETFRKSIPRDPNRGTRRYLVARRFDVHGTRIGHKLLWQSEAHTLAAAERAWNIVDDLGASPPALSELRARWPPGDLFLYPDLVCLDVDAEGRPAGHVVYVSAK